MVSVSDPGHPTFLSSLFLVMTPYLTSSLPATSPAALSGQTNRIATEKNVRKIQQQSRPAVSSGGGGL